MRIFLFKFLIGYNIRQATKSLLNTLHHKIPVIHLREQNTRLRKNNIARQNFLFKQYKNRLVGYIKKCSDDGFKFFKGKGRCPHIP